MSRAGAGLLRVRLTLKEICISGLGKEKKNLRFIVIVVCSPLGCDLPFKMLMNLRGDTWCVGRGVCLHSSLCFCINWK